MSNVFIVRGCVSYSTNGFLDAFFPKGLDIIYVAVVLREQIFFVNLVLYELDFHVEQYLLKKNVN